MSDDLLFGAGRYAVAGRNSQECAFIGSETCTGMALNHPGQFFRKSHVTEKIGSHLGMMYCMRFAPAYIMKHRTRKYEIHINIRIV